MHLILLARMAQLHNRDPTPTVEQLLREASKGSLSSSSFNRSKHLDSLQDHSHHHKKSVFTKVKEKAKKLRRSLSKKRRDDNAIPSLVEDEADEDTEYPRAPNFSSLLVYESKLGPKEYNEKAMQHPIATAISEKHVMPTSVKYEVEGDKEVSLTRSPAHAHAHAPDTSKTTPVYTVTHSFPSKIPGLSVEPPQQPSSPASMVSRKFSSAKSSPKSCRTRTTSKTFHDTSMPQHASSAPATPRASARNGYSNQIWDKGILMKEYLMNKLEPGEDDRALSQVISEAMSPRTSPEDKGVMEKFKDTVTSLLRNEEPPSQQSLVTFAIPVSTNAYKVGQEEEAHGRILQAN